MKYTLTFVAFFLFICTAFTQLDRCAYDSFENMFNTEEEIRAYQQRIIQLEQNFSIAQVSFRSNNNLIIPVAVHYQEVDALQDTLCLIALAKNQIDALNSHFRGVHEDTSRWQIDAPFFPNTELGSSRLLFVLANANHPPGYGLRDEQEAITINKINGDRDERWSNYLNIFVRPAEEIGRSPYGGNGDGDGVYISNKAFGIGLECEAVQPEEPYNEGKTLVHEIGHYFFLKHIWGKELGCDFDDDILDTPLTEEPHYDCSYSIETCGSLDMHFNFMDYVDDACMYMFTKEQIERMEKYVTLNLSNFMEASFDVIKTFGDCSAPEYLTITNHQDTTKLSWAKHDNAVLYEIRYRIVGALNWEILNTPANSIILHNIAVGTYQWQVRVFCNIGFSDWSEGTFNFPNVQDNQAIQEDLFVSVYPVPFNQELIIRGRYADRLQGSTVFIFIYDCTGILRRFEKRLVASGNNYFELPIQTHNLNAGTYFVKCTFSQVSKFIKVVKVSL